MKIDLLDVEKIIEVNNLEEVTSPNLFSSKMIFDPDGLLSNEIFGISKGDRRTTFAYIDLKRPFIHPHLYAKVVKALYRNVIYIVSGQKRYVIQDGYFVEDNENGWTGLASLYDHWDEINWSKSKSTNSINKDLLTKLDRDKVFITKILVCPPAYRDVTLAGTVDSSDYVNELNKLYSGLIRSIATLSEGGLFARRQYATQSKIQDTLVKIFDHFKSQISKKHGLIRQNLLGKSVDFGTRTVISAPNYNNERFEDNMIDIEHTAVPISQCCSTFYPFIEAWLKNYFTREIINDPNCFTFYQYIDRPNGITEVKEVTGVMKDPELQFSEKKIKKLINDYCRNPDNRFQPISIKIIRPSEKGEEEINAYIVLKGKILLENNIDKVLNRVMTVTDLLYLACVDVCEKRHVMVSRYPVGTDKGIFFSSVRVQSTAKHVHVVFNGVDYPYYPDIDINLDHEKVGVQFIDTLVMSNAHLDGMGADYDGDQVSLRGIWSDEANHECEEIMNRKTSALNITGANAKGVAKEVFNSYYELSKLGKDPKTVSDTDRNKYLSMSYSDITRTFLADTFADMVNSSVKNATGKHNPHYNTWDKITIPANYFYKGQKEIISTIGRFIINKFVLEGSGLISITGYKDILFKKSSLCDLDNDVGQYYLENKIDRKIFNSYLDRRDTLGYWANGMLAHTISERMLKPLPEVEKRKAELIEKYKDELDAGNIDVMTKISDELVAYAKDLLKDDPGMDLYDSGDLDFNNNYKNNSILKGAVMNKITNEYDFIGSSFMDGIEIKDIPAHANSILASQYPASIATKDAGYLGKKLLALLQMMEVDEEGTDCGTKNLIPIKITKGNKSNVLYSYIDANGQLLMLDHDNIDQYVGQTVMMRSPMSCINEKICSKCAGQLFYLLGAKHAGLFATQISHADLNLALKAKHNSCIDLYTLDPDSILEDI